MKFARTAGAGVLLLIALLPGCASRSTGSREPALPKAASYLHSIRTNGTAELRVAMRRFSSPAHPGQTVWLVGASHLGDAAYYAKLQELLNSQDVVLFEGVRASERAAAKEAAAEPQELDREALDDSLQGSMARALGLVFQLTAVDYSPKHFRNSDLSLPEMERLVTANLSKVKSDEGQAEAGAEFALLTQALSGDSWLNVVANVMLGFIQSSPKLQGPSPADADRDHRQHGRGHGIARRGEPGDEGLDHGAGAGPE